MSFVSANAKQSSSQASSRTLSALRKVFWVAKWPPSSNWAGGCELARNCCTSSEGQKREREKDLKQGSGSCKWERFGDNEEI